MDRNIPCGQLPAPEPPSLSARRAWIEIAQGWRVSRRALVALRKESVDRNVNLRVVDGSKSSSLSARRAWIEISSVISGSRYKQSRSPQGERG